MMIIHQVSKPD